MDHGWAPRNAARAMLRASDSGAAAHGVQPTGWAEQMRKELRPSRLDDEIRLGVVGWLFN